MYAWIIISHLWSGGRSTQLTDELRKAFFNRLSELYEPALPASTGSEAFLQSAQIDLDKGCETARKKTVGGSGGVASLLIGNWREPLRLTLDTSTLKKA